MQLYRCSGGSNQQWNLVPVSGTHYYSIVSVFNQKCIDVENFSQDNGANIQMYSCSQGVNQQFFFNSSDQTIVSRLPGRFGPFSAPNPRMCLNSAWSPFQTVGFVSPTKSHLILLVLNSSDQTIDFNLSTDIYPLLSSEAHILPHSFQTYLLPYKPY